MQKRLVTRYSMRSVEEGDENQHRVEAVFEELAVAPISSTAAFAHFQPA